MLEDLPTLEAWAELARTEGWDAGIPPDGLTLIQCVICGETHDTFPHWQGRNREGSATYLWGTCSPACAQERLAYKIEHALMWGKGTCSCVKCKERMHPGTRDQESFPCEKKSQTTA